MEKGLLEDKIMIYNSSQHRPVEDARELMEFRKRTEIMQNDKNYLTKENIGLVEKVRTLEDKLERMETDLTESKRKNSEYLEQLLN